MVAKVTSSFTTSTDSNEKSTNFYYQGFPTDIAEPGEEFDIYTGPGSTYRWVDAPDEGHTRLET